MPGQWVAAAAIVAALLFVSPFALTGNRPIAEVTAIVGATTLRALSARFHWITLMRSTPRNGSVAGSAWAGERTVRSRPPDPAVPGPAQWCGPPRVRREPRFQLQGWCG